MTQSRSPKQPNSPDGQPATSADSPAPEDSATSGQGYGTSTAPLSWPDDNARRLAANELAEAKGLKVLTRLPPPPEQTGDLAGVYEMVARSWEEMFIVLVTHPVTGNLIETEHFKTHHEGDLVALNHRHARRLLDAGAVVIPGVREERKRAELQRLILAQQAELDAIVARKAEAADVLMADLTDEQRALAELELQHTPDGPSVAPTADVVEKQQ